MHIQRLLLSLAMAVSTVVGAQTMSTMDAFNAGKLSGDQSHTQGMFNNINTTSGTNNVSGFSTTPPSQSSYWGGQNTILNNLYTGGSGKIAECQGGTSSTNLADQQHCQAVNAIMSTNANMPSNLITNSDPLVLQGKVVTANPESIAGAIDGNYSNCTTSTKPSNPDFTMQTCDDWSKNEAQSCTMGQEVTVDPDFIYRCSETLSTINNGTCSYGAVVQVSTSYNYQCTKSPYEEKIYNCNRTSSITVAPGTTPAYQAYSLGGRWDIPYGRLPNEYRSYAISTTMSINPSTYSGSVAFAYRTYFCYSYFDVYVYDPSGAQIGYKRFTGCDTTTTGYVNFPATTSGTYRVHEVAWGGCTGCDATKTYYATFDVAVTPPTYAVTWADGCATLESRAAP